MNIDDPTQAFVTKKILKGCQCLGSTKDTRLPITPEILRKIIHALNHTVPVFFQRCLLRSLFLLAFHAFLRLGEITKQNQQLMPIRFFSVRICILSIMDQA